MSARGAVESFAPELDPSLVEEMRARLRATRWPEAASAPRGEEDDPWLWGVDLAYLRELCGWWADEYDPSGLVERLGRWPSYRWRGLHLSWARSDGDGIPVLMIHGWPGAPLEFRGVVPALLAAGHDVVVPSLPGYGFSRATDPPLSGSGVADLLAELMAELGYSRYAVQGGDWGAYIAGRMAFAHPGAVAALHTNAPGLLPVPGDLTEPEMSEAEIEFARGARRTALAVSYHQLVQGLAPDSLGLGLHDSPAALAGWLVPRYRQWSDCGGVLERRFSKRDLCDLLTFYWATGTAAQALRLYAATRIDRWRLAPGERIGVATAACDFPHELVRPPREWVERICSDLRRWSVMESGGHFAAWEEPEVLAGDLTAFLGELD